VSLSSSHLLDLISGDPSIDDGLLACVGDTTIPVFEVLDRLALGRSEEEILAWSGSSRYTGYGGPLTREGIRAAAAYGAVLVSETRLSPPAEAALAGSVAGGVSIEQARACAGTVLGELARGDSQPEILARHRELSPELLRAAVAYSARIAFDDLPSAVVPETPEQTFLRDALSADDRRLVEEVFVYQAPFNRATPEMLLEGWRRFVAEVEEGYDDIYDEYTLALTRRDSLEDSAVTIVSPAGQERLLKAIRPWDRRFEAATRPIGQAISQRWMVRRWWWHRIPRTPADAVIEHLQGVGIIPAPEDQ